MEIATNPYNDDQVKLPNRNSMTKTQNKLTKSVDQLPKVGLLQTFTKMKRNNSMNRSVDHNY